MHLVGYLPRNAGTTFLVLIAVAWSFVSCQQGTPQPEIRAVLQAALDSANRAIEADASIEPARHYLDSVLNKHLPLSNEEKLLKYSFYHWYYTTSLLGDYTHANQIADSALLLFKDNSFKANHLDYYAGWILNKGNDLVQLKQLNEAYTYYYQVKSEFVSHWGACELLHFTTQLGNVRYKQKNYQQAISFYHQAYAQYRTCAETTSITPYYEAVTEPQNLLNGIAWFYELLNQPDSASHYYHQALTFLEQESLRFPDQQKPTTIAKGVIYGNLGGLYNKLGKYKEAQHFLTESIAINSQPRYDHRDVQTAQIKLADLYINIDRPADAKRVIDNCRIGLDSLPNEDFELRWRQVHWKYHDQLGNIPTAYAALQSYFTFKDSLEETNREMFRADFTAEFEQKEQQLAYAKLAYENKLSTIFLVISMMALILVLAIVYLIYTNWKRSKQNITRLNHLNDRINNRNEKLQLALLALQDSQHENTRLMAMVAHDLRNPLTNIKIGVDYILQSHERNDFASKTPILQVIYKSNNRALTLIDEFMHRYESEVSTISNDEIDLEAMLQDCVEIMQLRAAKKDQQLTYQGEPALVHGSREKIWRIITNLVENAIKFTPKAGQIAVRLQRSHGEAIIEVQDSGIGIDPAFQERLFEMGKSASREGTGGEPSTGLGLAIVKQIVTAHNGRIHFTSSLEHGTTFYVHLPITIHD